MSPSTGIRSTDRLSHFDFDAHNAEVKSLWADYNQGRATVRVPIFLGTNTRYFMFNPAANPGTVTFQQYIQDPDAMYDTALQFARWSRFNLLQDLELGCPETWSISPDFQNFYEAAWFGCTIEYFDDQVPDTQPAFVDDPESVMRNGLPDPFGGLMNKARTYFDHFKQRAACDEFCGRPVRATMPGCGVGTDGPFTVACNLFGAGQTCEMAADDPDRLTRLLSFITEATIARVAAWRQYAGWPLTSERYGFADDSVALISTPMYEELVLPHHRKLCDTFSPNGTRGVHLCGDATRHFALLQRELRIDCFDMGFPVDFAKLRKQLGPVTRLQGGPHVELLLNASPQAVHEETTRVLDTGVAASGRFLLREGNNLAPHTPLESTEAMYRAGRDWSARAKEQAPLAEAPA